MQLKLPASSTIVGAFRDSLIRYFYRAIRSMISPTYIVCKSRFWYHLEISGERKVSSVSRTAANLWHKSTKFPSSMNGIESL